MFLQDDHLTIRDALPSDAPQLVRWWNDGAVMAPPDSRWASAPRWNGRPPTCPPPDGSCWNTKTSPSAR